MVQLGKRSRVFVLHHIAHRNISSENTFGCDLAIASKIPLPSTLPLQ